MLTADSSISAILGGGKQNWHWGRVMKRDFHFVADSHFFFLEEQRKRTFSFHKVINGTKGSLYDLPRV